MYWEPFVVLPLEGLSTRGYARELEDLSGNSAISFERNPTLNMSLEYTPMGLGLFKRGGGDLRAGRPMAPALAGVSLTSIQVIRVGLHNVGSFEEEQSYFVCWHP